MRAVRRLQAVADSEPVSDEATVRRLFAAVASGDTGAFGELIERLGPRLHAYAFRLAKDFDIAEDVVQEAFIRLWQKRAELGGVQSACSFLYRLTRNLTIDHGRRQRSQELRLQRRGESVSGVIRAPDVEAEAREYGAAIERAIQKLSPRRREVFVLAHLHDLSYKEVAEITGLAPRTVANYLVAALEQLRAALRPLVD